MAKHAKTLRILGAAGGILCEDHPMTVRQVYYQLVSRQVIENNRASYQAVSNILVDARKTGAIPWEWIEDRLRRPRSVPMWDDPASFADACVRAYRRDVWSTQNGMVECWLEKDALSGIFEGILDPFGVTLCVGRGYDGWDSIHNAAERYGDGDGVTVLYFGDFDPSGEDMVRSLRERLGELGSEPEIVKVALVREDIDRYHLPPDFTKASDTRRAGFVAKWGDVSVELDALPADVLRARIESEVRSLMDLDALASVRSKEMHDREAIRSALSTLAA